MFPNKLSEYIKSLEIRLITDYHSSNDLVYNIGNKYILKVSDNINRLNGEYEKDLWISKYINSSKPILFFIENNKAYYLRNYLNGEILCLDKYLENPNLLIDILVKAINILHNTLVDDKKYIIDEGYNTLIHGDFCLPNILVTNENNIGYIDLGDAGIGDPWRDYAWCIWSLEYNLNSKDYTPYLLEKLNIKFDEKLYRKYTE